jgi:predicted secreted Zn-dependent protease
MRVQTLSVGGLVCVVAALGFCSTQGAQPGKPIDGRVVVTTNYYSVTGSTPFEVWRAMAQARPWKTNQAYNAMTEWGTRTQYGVGAANDGFRLDWYDAQTKVTVILPLWTPPPDVSPEMVRRWTTFYRALALHENGHVTHARLATGELLREAGALGAFNSRQELVRAARQMSNRVLEKYRLMDQTYDRQTMHGITQGARL